MFWGTKFTDALTDEFLKNVLEEKVNREATVEEGISYYVREDAENKYLCLVNMVDDVKTYTTYGNYTRLTGEGDGKVGTLEGYGYTVLVEKK